MTRKKSMKKKCVKKKCHCPTSNRHRSTFYCGLQWKHWIPNGMAKFHWTSDRSGLRIWTTVSKTSRNHSIQIQQANVIYRNPYRMRWLLSMIFPHEHIRSPKISATESPAPSMPKYSPMLSIMFDALDGPASRSSMHWLQYRTPHDRQSQMLLNPLTLSPQEHSPI